MAVPSNNWNFAEICEKFEIILGCILVSNLYYFFYSKFLQIEKFFLTLNLLFRRTIFFQFQTFCIVLNILSDYSKILSKLFEKSHHNFIEDF